jgi:hypothetical protein
LNLATNTKCTDATISTPTKITLAQLKFGAVTGENCGQKLQKKAQKAYATARALMGIPSFPRLNSAWGRVSGWRMRRQRRQPMERQ